MNGTPLSPTVIRESCDYIISLGSDQCVFDFFEKHPDAQGIIMCGRSNVGKSSLINALFRNELARTSKNPGRTQKINIFTFKLTDDDQTYFLYDLPGFGYAKVSKTERKAWDQFIGTFFQHLPHRHLIFHLMDAMNPFQTIDREFIQFLENFHLPTVLVLNKFDKLKKQSERALLKNKLKQSKLQHFLISAIQKKNIQSLEQILAGTFKSWNL
ncbi:MAG: YihA family ribosome biogenesis GTP-binding protein [Halobacteriovoraceae bacterium]|nr:YihA family ribosome biogenesis GTP-binding protein [Halobacteriovoraceae bacterium]MCB9095438.1 YihA family ribosome biogenesis GTP-binding protein [Halobacteriovoraceae bacterium]